MTAESHGAFPRGHADPTQWLGNGRHIASIWGKELLKTLIYLLKSLFLDLTQDQKKKKNLQKTFF